MPDDNPQPSVHNEDAAGRPVARNVLTVDVEEWFHLLEGRGVPPMEQWDSLECRVDRNVNLLLEAMAESSTVATFFWLGWVAERHKELVRKCRDMGHEIASHGYGHTMPYRMDPQAFGEDVRRGKGILEDIIGEKMMGFRAPGFGVDKDTGWIFDCIQEAGFLYDASSFPAKRATGDMGGCRLDPHVIDTPSGPLWECPVSVVSLLGRRMSLFSGGYLRIAPLPLIRWGVRKLKRQGRSLIVVVHPREVDPDHPRLPLGLKRRFKCYVNLKTTMPKLRWLCSSGQWSTMLELVREHQRCRQGPQDPGGQQ